MAPELFSYTDGADSYDGFAADIYSLGATLYTLAFGCPPFMANTELELAEMIIHTPVAFPRCAFAFVSVGAVRRGVDLRASCSCVGGVSGDGQLARSVG